MQIKFLGWIMDPKFRYFLYAWSSNASQGLGAQVVLAGNLNYSFNKYVQRRGRDSIPAGDAERRGQLSVLAGCGYPPDRRRVLSSFLHLRRLGIGQNRETLDYIAMIGNNLSTLGVSAAQLDNGFNTVSTSLVWTPTTGEFGVGLATSKTTNNWPPVSAGHFTRSDEDRQEQPNSEQFENTQIRLEDGSVIFVPNLFGPGITVNNVTYKMAAFDGGLKYRGFSLEGEYYLRWLEQFPGAWHGRASQVFSRGFQLQTSAMVIPKTLQVYLGGSTLIGKYGHPWDFRAGLNYFPFHNKVIRWNNEFLYLYKSPVGYTAVPFALGGTGPVFLPLSNWRFERASAWVEIRGQG